MLILRESEETSPVSEMPIKKNSEIPIRKKTPDCPVSEIPIRKKTPDVESMLDLNPMKARKKSTLNNLPSLFLSLY